MRSPSADHWQASRPAPGHGISTNPLAPCLIAVNHLALCVSAVKQVPSAWHSGKCRSTPTFSVADLQSSAAFALLPVILRQLSIANRQLPLKLFSFASAVTLR